MSDLTEQKPGTFNEIMSGLEDSVADMEVEQQPEHDEMYGEDESDKILPPKAEEEETEEEETEDKVEEAEEEEEEDEEEGAEEEEEEEGEEDGPEDSTLEETLTKETETEEEAVWTVKIDGKEREVDEEELLRGYQTAQASTKRFADAKKAHDEAKAFWGKMTDGHFGDAMVAHYAKQNGGDYVAARAEVVQKMAEFMAPELQEQLIEDEKERELHKQRREIEQQRKALEQEKAEAKSRIERQAEEEFISDLRVGIEKQMKRLKLPEKDVIWQRAGKLLDAAKSAGSTNEELLDLVPTVMKRIKEDRNKAARDLAATLTEDELEEIYPEQLKALKKKRIKKVKEKKSQKTKTDPNVLQSKKPGKKKTSRRSTRSDDIFADIRFEDFD